MTVDSLGDVSVHMPVTNQGIMSVTADGQMHVEM